ncbi:hypothetical protein [Natrinema caseinilyticum]|uniref:hypothetical protein n=1 Tax=Natrinema caseinilyticum TaxID=2961570 RepID=UPI0020C1FC81|nr:hypothetical protein [Natrinema caseinilyticum]
MANDPLSPFKKQIDSGATFKSDLLSGLDKTEWPGRIDYVASRVTHGDYAIGLGSSNPEYLTDGTDLEQAARDYYLEGIAALTGDRSRRSALPNRFRLGDLLVEFAGLRDGLEHVDRHDVPPGEILSRIIVRTIQRQAGEKKAQLARQLRADAETPRELVAELTTVPELAPMVQSALPESDDPETLTTKLASLDLTTELWDHQLEGLALWLHHGMNAYVDMATATGKTVLGLAAVAHAVDSGSLHPADQERLDDIFDGNLPEPYRDRPNDVLIVTTDDLLGVQWARLFQDHCHTPSSFTNVDDGGIQLPWGRIDIRSARGLADVDPSDYRLAIFDEVHNYSGRSGWGDHLLEFVESPCPVLALTGSVTDELESLVAQSDRPFPLVYRYTHELALADGVIPDFEWTLSFTDITDSDAFTQFRETAELFNQVADYDAGTYRLEPDALADAAPELSSNKVMTMAGEYVSGSALATGLREAGDDGTAPTDSLESLASGVSNRTIHRLNLRADLEPVIEIAEKALSEERPTLVLTRSYGEAKEIWEALYDRDDDRYVQRLKADGSATDHDDTIRAFDEVDTDEKVLIGPGKRIGQGNDIQSVEVGINIARPGSGVNASLVQRLGRLLRDAGGKDTVDFYHVVGVPPADATIKPDGESFVRTVAEFFGQVLEPDTDGILKPPSVGIEDGIESEIVALEQQGAPSIYGDDQSTVIESAYAAAIDEQSEGDCPAVSTDWFSAAFGDEAQPNVRNRATAGRVGRTSNDDTDAPVSTQEPDSEVDGFTSDDGNRSDEDEGETDVGKTVEDREIGDESDSTGQIGSKTGVDGDISPLAEHYDAFRSLGIIHKALLESAESDISDSDPLVCWIEDIRSIITDVGYGEQESGYGKQQVDRSEISIHDYREEHGTGDRVTDFNIVSVRRPSSAVMVLLKDSLSGLSSWVVPVAPESEVPLPVLVESEAELERARALLDEFPAEPPVLIDEVSDMSDDEASGELATAEQTETPSGDDPVSVSPPSDTQESTPTPVEDVRGVSGSVAEALRDAGYERLIDLQTAADEELESVDGVSAQRVQLIRATVGTR